MVPRRTAGDGVRTPRPVPVPDGWAGFPTGCYPRASRERRLPPTRSPTSDDDRGFRVANIKSQLKRIRTNEKARLRNKSVKSSLETAVRRFREAADAGEREQALTALRHASRQLDKAASKGVIHPNQAANKKSAMAQRANAL